MYNIYLLITNIADPPRESPWVCVYLALNAGKRNRALQRTGLRAVCQKLDRASKIYPSKLQSSLSCSFCSRLHCLLLARRQELILTCRHISLTRGQPGAWVERNALFLNLRLSKGDCTFCGWREYKGTLEAGGTGPIFFPGGKMDHYSPCTRFPPGSHLTSSGERPQFLAGSLLDTPTTY